MATPVQLCTTSGLPIGSFVSVAIYRVTPANVTINGSSISVATAPAAGALASGATLLGNYLFEKAVLTPDAKVVERMGAIGEDADWAMLRGNPKMSVTAQQASVGTPSLMNGDCFEIGIGMKLTSTAGSPAPIATTRWVIIGDSINYDAGDPTKFSCSCRLDRQNSSASLTEF